METQKKTSVLTALVILSTLVLSCLPCQTWSQAVPTPIRTVPVSTEEAESLMSKLGDGLTLDPEGRFVLRISEDELSSYVAVNMEESIADPQIILSNGKIRFYGTVASPLNAPIAATCSIKTAGDQVHIEVEAVAVGGFPIPETFVQSFTQQVIGVIASAQRQGHVEIVAIEIAEGELIVRGRVLH